MQTINISGLDTAIKLFGNYDENIKLLSADFNVNITLTGDTIEIGGRNAELCKSVIEKLLQFIAEGEEIDKGRIKYLEELAFEGKLGEISGLNNDIIAITSRGKPVKCKTIGQKKYVEAIKNNTLVIAVGPAGTGKTYLAVALAVSAYKKKQVEKIILTRPAVEAGEKLGFLPGDLQNKVDPYLRPLYDALGEMLGLENYQRLIERQVIEVAPLAYMRGRTLSSSFIILDEAQNATSEQMKMFLTRIGEKSKMVVNGDITQIDLGNGRTSGLIEAMQILKGVEDIAVVSLTHKDVVRQELVKNIIKAYDKKRTENNAKRKSDNA